MIGSQVHIEQDNAGVQLFAVSLQGKFKYIEDFPDYLHKRKYIVSNVCNSLRTYLAGTSRVILEKKSASILRVNKYRMNFR